MDKLKTSMNSAASGEQTQTNSAGMGTSGNMDNPNRQGGGGGGDFLDKGVDYMERRSGHEQDHKTTEKISDTVRQGFQKATGKDVPIKDKEYS